jgi:hypothetical protein
VARPTTPVSDPAPGPVPAPDPRPARTRRRPVWLALRLLVTAGLCAWIVAVVDWRAFWGLVRASDPWILALVVVMRLAGTGISAYKWQRLLRVHGHDHPLGRLTRWYLAATFLSHLLPTSIGGDAYRIYKTMDGRGPRSNAVVAVLSERLTGIVALVLMGLVAAVYLVVDARHPVAVVFLVVGGGATMAGAIALGLAVRLRLAERLTRARRLPRIVRSLGAPLADLRAHPGELARALLISFLFHLNRIAVIWLILVALGTTTDYVALVVASATVEVVGVLPITLGGFGLVEGSFIFVMGQFGVGTETALAGMLLMRVLLLPWILLGAVFYFMGDRGPSGPRQGWEQTIR